MGHRDNLDGGLVDPVNYPVRETSEEKFSRATQMHGPPLGTVLDLTDGVIEFRDESNRGRGIAFGIPLVGSLASAIASAWSLTLGAATGSSEDLVPRRGPGNRLYFLPFQIIDASRNFFTPRQFNILIDCLIQAFKQTAGKPGSRLGGKAQGLFQNFLVIGLHVCRLNAGSAFVNPYQLPPKKFDFGSL